MEPTLQQMIAFAGYRNVSLATARELIARGAGPDAFFSESPGVLAARTGLRPDFFDPTVRAQAMHTAARELSFITDHSVRPLWMSSPDFPGRLLNCDDAPAMLYTLGSASLNPTFCVGIVGTRHATAYGVDFTSSLVRDLALALSPDLQIVSGLAYGIDIAAHEAALREGIPTGAVLAHGLNTIYPAEHRSQAARMVREGGFLITEYTSSARTRRSSFLARNRIVAGLVDALVVVESDIRGGAMSTARIASAYSREVFALPGRISDPYSRGTNQLIAHGTARIIRDAADLIDALGWQQRVRHLQADSLRGQLSLFPELTPEKAAILRALDSDELPGVNELCVRLAMPYAALSGLLFEMEMDSLLISLPGGRFSLSAAGRQAIEP